ncbi:MAG: toxin-antitoxin system protein [Moorellales bacterium]
MTRIPERALSTLKEIAALTGQPRQEILEKALEAYRRQLFLERANAAFAALKADRREWEAEREERKAWDVTLADGLDE